METTPEIDAILAKPLHAVAGFNRPGNSPHLSVVWFDWDGTTFRLSTLRSRLKYRLFTRDPHLSLLINDPETLQYVAAVGEAHEEGGHAELSKRMFARYLPGQNPGDRPDDPDRVVLALTPERITSGS
ncbi:PPOX class probable F420-dependent enzyme [Kribbella voronezhensis]|uniref:PPOX class probable F420-dependent enzyme n=1 Tax=Kribbella voronezhensis TaxID=2512212 RepID=A0A4R7T7N0_9ACTN|nr:pyridoxamine 5'-phosphate oxidase family protein [Kribbella voronezhensis]TDU87894.1 PPOX class probable F420-dependent enzyme [Kribbella voronezhensis]